MRDNLSHTLKGLSSSNAKSQRTFVAKIWACWNVEIANRVAVGHKTAIVIARVVAIALFAFILFAPVTLGVEIRAAFSAKFANSKVDVFAHVCPVESMYRPFLRSSAAVHGA